MRARPLRASSGKSPAIRLRPCFCLALAVSSMGLVTSVLAQPGRVRLLSARELVAPKSAAFNGRGEIAIAQEADDQILLLSSDGTLRAVIGRSGAGPGEFEQLGRIGWVGDTLWATDTRSRRITRFDRSGKYLSSILVVPPSFGPPTGSAAPMGQLSSGLMVYEPALIGVPAGGSTALVTPVVLLDSAGTTVRTLLRRPRVSSLLVMKGSRGTGVGRQPIDDAPIVLLERNGRGVVAVSQGTSDGTGAVATLFLAPEFAPTTISLGARGRGIAVSEADSIRRAVLEEKVGVVYSSSAEGMIDLLSAVYIPRAWPPVARAVLGRDGLLWTKASRSLRNLWLVTSLTTGRSLQTELPPAVEVLDSFAGRLLTSQVTADDVPSLWLSSLPPGVERLQP